MPRMLKYLTIVGLAASLPLSAQQPAPAAQPDSPARVELRLIDAALRETIKIMAGGATLQPVSEPGPWLVLAVQVTTPGKGFGSTPTLTGPGLRGVREPRGVGGEWEPAADTPFLEYAGEPAFVSKFYVRGTAAWVGLTRDGAYGGAGFIDRSGNLQFVVTTKPQLEFVRAGVSAVTLAFNVADSQAPYVLSIAGASMNIPANANPGQVRR